MGRLPIAIVLAVFGAAMAVPSAPAQVPAGPLSSKGVEFIRNVAKHIDSPGGRLVGKYFYLTTERDLTIYDVSMPENPREVGSLAFGEDGGTYYYPQEDPDTNGKVLITSNAGAIEVIDVSDKTAPKIIGRLAGPAQHTISCVLDCTWAYGSGGTVIDLRDPTNPKLAGSWRTKTPPITPTPHPTTATHDVTEVAPGIVMTSSQPMYLLDARRDPANPTKLASIEHADKRFIHANLWPHQMQDEMLLVGGEDTGPGCEESASGTFMTYSAADWQTSGFKLLDEFRVMPGTPDEGLMPTSTFCVHWFDPHPTYRNGGLVAIGWYEQGMRVLDIASNGKITEVGHFIPLGGTTSAAYWITDRILYLADYNRGLDVVRFTGEVPTPPAPAPAPGQTGGGTQSPSEQPQGGETDNATAAPTTTDTTSPGPPEARSEPQSSPRSDSVDSIPAAGGSRPTVRARFKLVRGRTAVRELVVSNLAEGSRVTVRCATRAHGCPRAKSFAPRGASLDLTGRFARRLLEPGAVITIKVASPAGRATVVRYRTRMTRRPTRTGR